MSEQWITVKEAAKIKRCTDANIRYLITVGKLEAKKEKGKWLVNPETLESEKDFSQTSDTFAVLQKQLEEKDKQIERLQKQLEDKDRIIEDTSSRHDTIVLQLTRQLEQSQRLLEYHQDPWYRRWFRRKQTLDGRQGTPSNSKMR